MNQHTNAQLHMDREMEQDMRQSLKAERSRRKRRRTAQRILAWLLAAVLLLAAAVAAASLYIWHGGRQLYDRTAGSRPSLDLGQEAAEVTGPGNSYEPRTEAVWQEGWIRCRNKVYEYNDDLITFLVMGIDKMEEVTESSDDVSGGQADALFLVVINPDGQSIKVLAVNRDTMTDVVVYDAAKGKDSPAAVAQIATQHGFGDGRELSCELTRDAVSGLFYDLPISGYVAVNMAAIPELNDALGGVDVDCLENLDKVIKGAREGVRLHLEGMNAFWYVKYRDVAVFESARGRLARQKQYLTAFIGRAIAAAREDITLPLTLYGKLKRYMVTDVTADEAAYLASELIHYSFDRNDIYTLEGITEMGEKHEEFYPDQDALRDLMVQLFYREVELP